MSHQAIDSGDSSLPCPVVVLVSTRNTGETHIRDQLRLWYRVMCADSADAAVRIVGDHEVVCILVNEEFCHSDRKCQFQDLVRLNLPVVVFGTNERAEAGTAIVQQGIQDYVLIHRLTRTEAQRVVVRAIERHQLILERDRALRDQEASEQWFQDVANRIADGLWVRSADGTRCLYLNPAFEAIWGRSLNDMNEIAWAETVHPDDRAEGYRVFCTARDLRTEYKHVYRVVRPDGDVRIIENHGFPVLDKNDHLVRMAGIARDVTNERRLQNELRVAQKLESIGQLAAGIAHEINTPTQYVSDNNSFLMECMSSICTLLENHDTLLESLRHGSIEQPLIDTLSAQAKSADLPFLLKEIPSSLEQSRQGIEQIRKIVLAMREFSHPTESSEPVDINDVIQKTLIVARNEWKYVADIETNFDNRLPPVACIRSAIGQVVLNLLVNAAHAIADSVEEGEKGVIELTTRVEKDSVVVEISDNGSGISNTIQDRIFDPFFTTKEVGRGTGQGLAIAYSIITDQHGGTIFVDSEPGQGSRFTFTLPIDGMRDAPTQKAV